MMYARVIPVLRTPIGVDVFDYQIPASLDIKVGQLVWVPFRRRPTPALVMEILMESPFAKKALPISAVYSSLLFPFSIIELLQWTAEQTFCSRATVLKSWVRNLPKRPLTLLPMSPAIESKDDSSPIHEQWINDSEEMIITRALKSSSQHERLLIITPWKNRVEFYSKQIPHSHILHSNLNDGDAFRAWSRFLTEPTAPVLIATRVGAWLAPLADRVILDEPENDDHKQDELAPRYDARKILTWCSQHTNIAIESYGLTPPLTSQATAPVIDVPLHVHIRHPQGGSSIPMIQSDTLHELRTHDGPRVIIHPIRGVSARLTCRDCGWRSLCTRCQFPLSAEFDHALCHVCGLKAPLPLKCETCGGADLGKSLPGIERLKAQWIKNEPDTPVEWRDLSNESMDPPFPQKSLVVITDGSMLGGGEDVRRRERQCIAFRRLADRVAHIQGRLIIQCEESSANQWSAWLTQEGFDRWRTKEWHERQLFNYPPAVRLVKIISEGDEQHAKQWIEKARQTIKIELKEVRGPFAVKFRSAARAPRWVYHLIFSSEVSDQQLINELTPLAKSAFIDLDPIAFLR